MIYYAASESSQEITWVFWLVVTLLSESLTLSVRMAE